MKKVFIFNKRVYFVLHVLVAFAVTCLLCIATSLLYGDIVFAANSEYYTCPGNEYRITIKYDPTVTGVTYRFSGCDSMTVRKIDHVDGADTYGIRITEEGSYIIHADGNSPFVLNYDYTAHIGHDYADHSTIDKEPTCEEDGIESIHCNRCDNRINATSIPKLGHEIVHHSAKDPTCTEDGWEEYDTCTRCDYTTFSSISKLGHLYVDGTCSRCGETEIIASGSGWKLDAKGKLVITDMPTWRNEYTPWRDYRNIISEVYIGDNDNNNTIGDYAFQNCKQLSKIRIPESVTTIGFWAFYNCSSLKDITIPEGVTSIDAMAFWNCTGLTSVWLPASAISIEYDAFWKCDQAVFNITENSYAHTFVQENQYKYDLNGEHTVVTLLPEEPDCVNSGKTEGSYCATCGKTLVPQEEIEAFGHKPGSYYVVDKESTCSEEGFESIHCSVCGESIETTKRIIEKKDHHIEILPKENATCTKTGLTEGARCDVCGQEIIKQDVIPATGHSFGAWTTLSSATEVSTGMQHHTCVECGISETRSIPQLKPTLPSVKISKPKASKKAVTVKWRKVSKKNRKKVAFIQIQYSPDKSFKNGVKTVTAKKSVSSKKIKKLVSKKKYYVRVRAYKRTGNTVHVSAWSKVRVVKVK